MVVIKSQLCFLHRMKKKHSCKTQPPRVLRDKTAQQKQSTGISVVPVRNQSHNSSARVEGCHSQLGITSPIGGGVSQIFFEDEPSLTFVFFRWVASTTNQITVAFSAGWQGGPHLEAICGGEVRSSRFGFRSPLSFGEAKKKPQKAPWKIPQKPWKPTVYVRKFFRIVGVFLEVWAISPGYVGKIIDQNKDQTTEKHILKLPIGKSFREFFPPNKSRLFQTPWLNLCCGAAANFGTSVGRLTWKNATSCVRYMRHIYI